MSESEINGFASSCDEQGKSKDVTHNHIKAVTNNIGIYEGERVYVNVYHLHWPNGMKMGAFHTGTELFGKEYGYGGHPYPSSGIFQIDPKCSEDMGFDFTFKESIYMGRTYLSLESVERLLISMTDEFTGDAYHLLRHNCNHFTAQFVQLLCGAQLPGWINWLAKAAGSLRFVENILPPHWVRPCPADVSDSEDDVYDDRLVEKSEHTETSSDLDAPSQTGRRQRLSTVNSVNMLERKVSQDHASSSDRTSLANGDVPRATSSGPRIIELKRC